MSNQRKSRPHLEGFLMALAIFGVILLVAWNHSANAADLANDVSTAAVIDPEESPWSTIGAREMGVQLERALDVAFDELRKVDQSVLGEFRPRVHVLIYRQDGSIVEVIGQRQSIVRNVHRDAGLCFLPGDHFGTLPAE
jgi:hypothetical protein